VLEGPILAGATTIMLRASQAVGRILAGDRLAIGATSFIAVATTVTAREPSMDPAIIVTPGFDAITLTSPAPAAPDGAPITPIWSADRIIPAAIQSYSLSLRNDQILAGDEEVIIAAYGNDRPDDTDILIFDGTPRSVVDVYPVYVLGLAAAWRVHVR